MRKRIILSFIVLMLCIPEMVLRIGAVPVAASTQEPILDYLESASISQTEARVGDTITIKAKLNVTPDILRSVQTHLSGDTEKLVDMTYNVSEDKWVGTYQIQPYDHQGKWNLSFYIERKDGAWGNPKTGQSITIINPNEDRALPVVNSITIDPQLVKAGEPFRITAKISDNYGIASVKANFLKDGVTRVGPKLTYDSSKDEWTLPYTFDTNMLPGDWQVELTITDVASNVTTATKAFQLSNPNIDTTAPTFKSLTVSKQVVTHSEELKVQADISDDNSGIAFAELRFEYVDLSHFYSFRLEKNLATGLWETTIKVPTYFESGSFNVYLQVEDKAGNAIFPRTGQTLQVYVAKPIVNKVTATDTSVQGQAEPGFTIEVKAGDTVLGTTTVGADRKFIVSIPAQKEGTELSVSTIDLYGKRSVPTKTVVEKVKLSGWVTQQGKRYYYDPVTNTMKTGWLQLGRKWYYFNKSGAMVTGWVKSRKHWYYLKSDGVMVTGRVKIEGKSYYFYNRPI
ncbi:Ig-like domain-containing protein [Neobacillus drentensis]|uniref:Ig-like domain-containing protein n=1 Tax=Neobacillus drentensis TaxID=220684 RepID=UPI002FFF1404